MHKLKQAIQKGKKVLWCDDETEEALKVLWKSQEFQHRSQHAQEIKNKTEVKYSLGSVSTVIFAFKMEKHLKRKSKKIEVFEKTHTNKGDETGKVVWCDKRSKEMAISLLFFFLRL